MLKRILASLAILAGTLTAAAQVPADTSEAEPLRPVTSAYMLRAGSSHLADTYLSPQKFAGWHLGLGYERMQAMKFSPDKWVMRLAFSVEADRAASRVKAPLWYWGLDFSWSMMRRWHVWEGLTLALGGEASLDAGCVYNSRNGNNPASAKGAVTVGVTGYAAWNVRVGSLPVTLRYQPSLPVIGAFFAPDYGELYYEIYLGNRSGLAHCAWWGNYLQSDHLLTADLHFGATSLRLGYSGSFLSTKINHTVTHIFTHAAVVGISGEWLSVNPRKGISPRARTISALF